MNKDYFSIQYCNEMSPGPVCLGIFKENVHAIYLPKHTKPESKIIIKNKYCNTEKIPHLKL